MRYHEIVAKWRKMGKINKKLPNKVGNKLILLIYDCSLFSFSSAHLHPLIVVFRRPPAQSFTGFRNKQSHDTSRRPRPRLSSTLGRHCELSSPSRSAYTTPSSPRPLDTFWYPLIPWPSDRCAPLNLPLLPAACPRPDSCGACGGCCSLRSACTTLLSLYLTRLPVGALRAAQFVFYSVAERGRERGKSRLIINHLSVAQYNSIINNKSAKLLSLFNYWHSRNYRLFTVMAL